MGSSKPVQLPQRGWAVLHTCEAVLGRGRSPRGLSDLRLLDRRGRRWSRLHQGFCCRQTDRHDPSRRQFGDSRRRTDYWKRSWVLLDPSLQPIWALRAGRVSRQRLLAWRSSPSRSTSDSRWLCGRVASTRRHGPRSSYRSGRPGQWRALHHGPRYPPQGGPNGCPPERRPGVSADQGSGHGQHRRPSIGRSSPPVVYSTPTPSPPWTIADR